MTFYSDGYFYLRSIFFGYNKHYLKKEGQSLYDSEYSILKLIKCSSWSMVLYKQRKFSQRHKFLKDNPDFC